MRRVFVFLAVCLSALLVPITALAVTPTSFSARTDYAVGSRPLNVRLTDVNGDGRRDIVVPNAGSDTVSVLIGDGAGRFAPTVSYRVGDGPVYTAMGDVTGDGRVDIVSANEFSDNLSLLPGDGTGRFGTPGTVPSGDGPTFVGITRLNGDALPDLAVADFEGDSIAVHLGSGAGTFSAVTTSAAGDGPHGWLADVNRDGRSDFLLADYYSNSLMVRLGDGAGRFGSDSNFSVGLRPVAVTAGDLNGDGAMDLVTANYSGNSVSILLGNGSGGFTRTLDNVVGLRPAGLDISDVNGDGAADISVSNYDGLSVSFLLGDGAGRFTRDVDRTVGGKAWGVATGDLNGDGRLDVVTSNASSSTVSVLLNTTQSSTPGVSGEVRVNSGAQYTTSAQVTLQLSATGSPTQMMLANEPTFASRSWQAFSASAAWSLTPGDGSKTVYAKFRNAAGTESSVATASVLLDSVAPATTRSALPTEWVNRNQALTLAATDAGSGVAATTYRLSPPGTTSAYTGTVNISTEGNTTIEYRSSDRAGNVEPTKTASVRIDRTPPVTTSDSLPSYLDSATIRMSASDALSGVAATEYSLDGGATRTGSSVTVTSPGAHTLRFSSRDVAGNVETSRTASFSIGPRDSLPPTTTISPVIPEWVNHEVTFTLAAIDDSSGVSTTYYRVLPGGTTSSYSKPVTITAEGVITVEYRSVDRSGNSEATKTASYRIDRSAPVTTSDYQSNYIRTATIRLSSADAFNSVAATYYRLDLGPTVQGTTVTTSAIGRHTLTFWSVDTLGNTEAQKQVRFRIRR